MWTDSVVLNDRETSRCRESSRAGRMSLHRGHPGRLSVIAGAGNVA